VILRNALWCLGVVAVIAPLIIWGPIPETRVPGRTVISYWEKWTGFEGEAMQATVDAFNASQDRVFVKLLTVSQVDRKMLLATAGNEPPDVVGLWSYNVDAYADKGALLPLDEYCADAGIDASDYVPVYWEMCQHRGRTWSLPTTPATVALHWNKQLFREAGLDPERPPETLSELAEYAERLTIVEDGEVVRLGYIPAEPGWWNWAWGYFFGAELWDEESQITCDDPGNIAAFEWVAGYAQRYGVQQLQTFRSGFGSFSSPANPFLSGKVAMVLQGVWMHNFIDTHAPGLEWGAAPFPYPDGHPELKYTTIADMDVLCIPASSQHPDEAFEFIRYVNSVEGMEILCMGQRKHSPLREVTEQFTRDHPNPYIELFTDLGSSPNAYIRPRMGLWTEYQSELTNAFDRVWLGEVTAKAALSEVKARMQPKLDREIERWARRGDSYAEGLGPERLGTGMPPGGWELGDPAPAADVGAAIDLLAMPGS